jgi:TPR repeat protein
MVGVMYAVGSGVAQDYAAARKWYQKAAEQGLAEAQIALGMMYFAGHGVGQNYCIAASWYRKAATQGNELAQYLLGSMLYDGLCSKNHKEAIVWLTKAAEQGLPEQYALDVQKKLDLIEAERE